MTIAMVCQHFLQSVTLIAQLIKSKKEKLLRQIPHKYLQPATAQPLCMDRVTQSFTVNVTCHWPE